MFAGLRAATAAGGFLGVALTCWDDCTDSEERTSTAIGVASSAALLGLVVWDLATVKGAVRRHEAQRVSIMPMYDPVRRSPGVMVRLKF
jgi:hypothetical protein